MRFLEELYGQPERAVPGLIALALFAVAWTTESISATLALGFLAITTWRYWSARLVIDDPRLGPLILHCPHEQQHCVWLTFDDGPGPETLAIIEELNQRRLVGTFFFVGEQIEQYPHLSELQKALTRGGHSVANHTFSHPNLLKLSPQEIESEILRTEELLETYFPSLKAPLFRPPYGYRSRAVLDSAERSGLSVVGWSLNSLDFLSGPTSRVIERVESRLQAGSIVLFHDGREKRERTLKALPALLNRLVQREFGAYSPR